MAHTAFDPRRGRSAFGWTAAALLACTLAQPARAEYLDTYLPTEVPGFDRDMGLNVLALRQKLYSDEGLRTGPFIVRGGLDERFGVNSNITGTNNGPSSPFLETNPSVSAESDWNRNRLGAAAVLDRYDYFSAPRQSHSDYTVALGGGWTILRNSLDVGYSHVHGNEFGSSAGALAYDAPVPFDVDVLRSAYTWDRGRLQFTPNIDVRYYQYGNALLAGQTISQRYRDRIVVSGGVTTRYLLGEQRSAVLVVQGSGASFQNRQRGAPTLDSQSVLVLPGIDYQASGPWRIRLLLGGEVRTFSASQYGSRVAPVAEGSLIYTPTGLTTITATIRRSIEAPEAEGTSGYTQTGFDLVVDHEWWRNTLLQGTAGIRYVDYFQQLGHSLTYTFGAGATRLVDNHLGLFASYRFTRQDSGGAGPQTIVPAAFNVLPSFTQHLFLIGARWKL